ncbi:HlyD family secretion protein [Acetobacteraceae bacterium KSS8]|uniref:HlyD family secretion protein n=1 Tax=Endosaccharibacter trunci TaxID=2812733 RepID=A0ABT1W7Q3_9PROT|nr:HlyD family secretion protein [Acetobacteraceae bacterium KSS8]
MAATETTSMRDVVSPPASRLRHLRPRQILLGLAGIAALAGAAWYGHGWWTKGRFVESTDDAYVGGDVTTISPHVAGFIASIPVTDNGYVGAGQILVRLDRRDFEATLQGARASLAGKRAAAAALAAQLDQQDAVIAAAEADLRSAEARDAFARQEAVRYAALVGTVGGSRQNAQRAASARDDADAAIAAAEAKRIAADAQRGVLQHQIAGAKAAIAEAEAAERTASLNLGYTDIRSPIDGYVANRAAQVGAYAATGSYLMSVVPATALWVDANFKEDQLAHIRAGQAASVVADVAPGQVIIGHVASLTPGTGAVFSVIPPENATGNFTKIVQRVPVRIVLDRKAAELGLLRPGLSVTVSIDTRG